MKKILTSVFAAAALLFGLASCSGDLHDKVMSVTDLSAGAVPGDFDSPANWDNKTAWTSIDAATNTYTLEFTTKADCAGEVGFKILTVNGEWNVAGYAEPNAVAAGGEAVFTMISAADMGGAGNAKMTGMKAGTAYKLTVVANPDTTVTAKLEESGASAPALPTPYYFDGLYLVGGCFKTGSMDNLWSFGADNLIHGASLEKSTGVVTYTKDIIATAASGEMGINDSSWNNKLAVKGTAVAADGKAVVVTGDGEKGNWNVTGLKVDSPYRVTITTTPEKQVSVTIEEICTYTLTFKITGLTEGMKAWINGTPWTSDWKTGWALADWGGTKNGFEVSDAAVADENGVAVFGSKFNVTGVGKPGETLSFEVKFIASDDNWTSTKYNNPNIAFDVENLAPGTYLVTVDAEENEATVTKQ